MLGTVDVYTSEPSVDTLNLASLPELDILEVVDIQGLDPVKASINTVSLASVAGEEEVGTTIPSRNIVLLLRGNPDYSNWTPYTLRQLVYTYFTPENRVRLVFSRSDDPDDNVEIFGKVESCDASSFTEDIDYVVSIICPDPYFTAVTPTESSGSTVTTMGTDVVTYEGNVPVGFFLTVTKDSNDASFVNVQLGDSDLYFNVTTVVNDSLRFEMDSRSKKKMVRQVDTGTGTAVSALRGLQDGSQWPLLEKGDNIFNVITDTGGQSYQLKYFAKYSGL